MTARQALEQLKNLSERLPEGADLEALFEAIHYLSANIDGWELTLDAEHSITII
jgi:hypothetical protein